MHQNVRLRQASAWVIGILVSGSSLSFGQVIYDSNGFEPTPSPGYTSGQPLAGQPAGASAADKWVDGSFIAPGSAGAVSAYVESYPLPLPAGSTNSQFVSLGASKLQYSATPGLNDEAFYFPGTFSSGYDGTGKEIAIRFTMAATSTAGTGFLGVVAYDGNNFIGEAGVDDQNQIFGAETLTTAGQSFFASPGVFYQYELLLDFPSQTYTIYGAPADNTSPFVALGSAPFQTTTEEFTDADLSAFSLGTTYSGSAGFDYYSISNEVPEPAGLCVVALSLLGLSRKRRS